MKKLILFGLTAILLVACMKHDVLKQDATGNFRESEFYTSGQFQFDFDIVVSNIVITSSGNPGQLLCRPAFDISVAENFITKLENDWNGSYKLIVTDSKPFATPFIFNTTNLHQPYSVSLSAISCSQPNYFDVRLELISPSTTVVASVEKRFEITP